MPHEFYFIPLLLDALDAADPDQALTEAFETIRDLGQQPAYQHGFRQFLWFMEEVRHQVRKRPADVPAPVVIDVLRDGHMLDTLVFGQRGETRRVRRITPGQYALRLSTGRVLWQGVLAPQDLEWGAAFPERPFPLAADTEGVAGIPTRAFDLLERELTVRVLPGVEAGVLEVTVNA